MLWLARHKLKSKNPATRASAVAAIGSICKPWKTFGLLCRALKDESEMVRSAAFRALANSPDCFLALKDIISAVADPSPEIRKSAIAWVINYARVASPPAPLFGLDAIVSALCDPEAEIRQTARAWVIDHASALACSGARPLSQEARGALFSALEDPNAQIRQSARALLINHLREEPDAILALGKQRSPSTTDLLVSLLHEEQGLAKAFAARILRQWGYEPADPEERALILEQRARMLSEGEKFEEMASLGAVAVPLLLAWIRHKNNPRPKPTYYNRDDVKDYEKTRERADRAEEALLKVQDPAATRPLIEALRSDSNAIRLAATATLCKMDSRVEIGPLVEALRDQNVAVRAVAFEVLCKTGTPDAVNALFAVLNDKGVDLGEAPQAPPATFGVAWQGPPPLVFHLRHIKDRRVIPHLVSALHSDDDSVAKLAAESLQETGLRDVSIDKALVDLLIRSVDRQCRAREAHKVAYEREYDSRLEYQRTESRLFKSAEKRMTALDHGVVSLSDSELQELDKVKAPWEAAKADLNETDVRRTVT